MVKELISANQESLSFPHFSAPRLMGETSGIEPAGEAQSQASDSHWAALERQMLEHLLETVHFAVIVVDSRSRLRIVNSMAREILKRHDGLGLAHGCLVGSSSLQTAGLRALIAARASGVPGGTLDNAFVITRPSGMRPYNLMLLTASLPSSGTALVALVTADPDQEPALDTDLLRRFYGLTPTEAKLAYEIAAGRTLNEAADSFGISVGTARVHLKHVFDKTGTCRQAELVHLLLSAQAQIVPNRNPLKVR